MAVLILGALTGKRRVAARMASAALEALGRETLLLPTMLLSATYDLGAPALLDATDYLSDALARLTAIGQTWDAALIGGVTGKRQAALLCEAAERSRARGALVLVDPVLGDGGRAYNSVTPEQTEAMAMLIAHADVVTPNLTEACLLTGTPYARAGERQGEMLSALCGGKRAAVITSAFAGDGSEERAVLGMDAAGARFSLPYAVVPGRHLGTGDLFAALLADGLLRALPLPDAAARASAGVADAIRGEGIVSLPE